jgi:hypothetical protein
MSSSAAEGVGQRRLLILPTEVAGYASRVAQGFREMGWTVDVLDLSGNPYGYPTEPASDHWIARANEIAQKGRGLKAWRAGAAKARTLPLILAVGTRSIREYDAVLYLYGKSLLWRVDPWLARRAGATVVSVFLGSDARPAYLSGWFTNADRPISVLRTAWAAFRSSRRVRMMEAVSDVVVCHPASGHFLRRPFVNWLAVGMPCVLEGTTAPPRNCESGSIVLLHAPSAPRQKGSVEISAAVAQLQDRGIGVELVTLTGRPNSEVVDAIRAADAVVDELYSDTPLAGLASEAAGLGRPVITFGYAKAFLAADLTRLGIPHEHYLRPEDLTAGLERVITDREWRETIAHAAHDYVANECRPIDVARRLHRLIDDGPPEGWMVDPVGIEFVEGWGAPREETRTALNRYLRALGPWALFLPSAGRAESALRGFAGGPCQRQMRWGSGSHDNRSAGSTRR